jgi:damage-control phosphatase, subfamily I
MLKNMKTYYECIPCFLAQTVRALDAVDPLHHEDIVRKVLHKLGDTDFLLSPPEIVREVFKVIESYNGKIDYYADAKKKSNKYILDMYEELSEIISNSDDPFDTAMRLAIAGNIIDFGAKHDFSDKMIHTEIEKVLVSKEISSDFLKDEVKKAKKILYVGDNCGEIVFDKLFLKQLPIEKITYAVRGEAVLNDVLLEDAEMVGLTDMLPVISNGSAFPGTVLNECSSEFREVFNNADLIISKGQGNYETMSGLDHNIIFLLMIKCSVIGRDIGYKTGSFVVRRSDKWSHNA